MEDHVHDVVIVGARAAGAATAMLLARAGLDVMVLDRSPAGSDTLSTHALMRGGVLQLHRWGLLDDIVAAGTPAVRHTTFVYAREVVPIAIRSSYGVDALYAPRRTVLDPIIVRAARQAGAVVRYGTTVTGLERDSDDRVHAVLGRDENGRAVRHRGRWIVGADGIGSVVAADVGVGFERRGTATTAIVYGYWPDLDIDEYRWIFRPDACAGAIPTNGGETCVFAAASPGRIGRGGLDVLRQVVASASPDLAARVDDIAPVGDVRRFAGRVGYMRRPWGPGFALVGDAGYWKDPIGAHGLTDALRDAELLATAIGDVAGGRSSEREAFEFYHWTRNRLSVPFFDIVDVIASMRWNDREISSLLVQLNAAMSDEVEAIAAFGRQPELVRRAS